MSKWEPLLVGKRSLKEGNKLLFDQDQAQLVDAATYAIVSVYSGRIGVDFSGRTLVIVTNTNLGSSILESVDKADYGLRIDLYDAASNLDVAIVSTASLDFTVPKLSDYRLVVLIDAGECHEGSRIMQVMKAYRDLSASHRPRILALSDTLFNPSQEDPVRFLSQICLRLDCSPYCDANIGALSVASSAESFKVFHTDLSASEQSVLKSIEDLIRRVAGAIQQAVPEVAPSLSELLQSPTDTLRELKRRGVALLKQIPTEDPISNGICSMGQLLIEQLFYAIEEVLNFGYTCAIVRLGRMYELYCGIDLAPVLKSVIQSHPLIEHMRDNCSRLRNVLRQVAVPPNGGAVSSQEFARIEADSPKGLKLLELLSAVSRGVLVLVPSRRLALALYDLITRDMELAARCLPAVLFSLPQAAEGTWGLTSDEVVTVLRRFNSGVDCGVLITNTAEVNPDSLVRLNAIIHFVPDSIGLTLPMLSDEKCSSLRQCAITCTKSRNLFANLAEAKFESAIRELSTCKIENAFTAVKTQSCSIPALRELITRWTGGSCTGVGVITQTPSGSYECRLKQVPVRGKMMPFLGEGATEAEAESACLHYACFVLDGACDGEPIPSIVPFDSATAVASIARPSFAQAPAEVTSVVAPAAGSFAAIVPATTPCPSRMPQELQPQSPSRSPPSAAVIDLTSSTTTTTDLAGVSDEMQPTTDFECHPQPSEQTRLPMRRWGPEGAVYAEMPSATPSRAPNPQRPAFVQPSMRAKNLRHDQDAVQLMIRIIMEGGNGRFDLSQVGGQFRSQRNETFKKFTGMNMKEFAELHGMTVDENNMVSLTEEQKRSYWAAENGTVVDSPPTADAPAATSLPRSGKPTGADARELIREIMVKSGGACEITEIGQQFKGKFHMSIREIIGLAATAFLESCGLYVLNKRVAYQAGKEELARQVDAGVQSRTMKMTIAENLDRVKNDPIPAQEPASLRGAATPMGRLENALKSADAVAVIAALQDGARLDKPVNKNDHTLLHIMVQNRQAKLFENVFPSLMGIQSDFDINARDVFKRTALHYAFRLDLDYFARVLIDAGADCYIQDDRGCAPLHLAAKHGHRAVIKMFLKKYAQLVEMRSSNGLTALMHAASHGNDALVDLLLELGADPSASVPQSSGESRFAISFAKTEDIRLKINHAINKRMRDQVTSLDQQHQNGQDDDEEESRSELQLFNEAADAPSTASIPRPFEPAADPFALNENSIDLNDYSSGSEDMECTMDSVVEADPDQAPENPSTVRKFATSANKRKPEHYKFVEGLSHIITAHNKKLQLPQLGSEFSTKFGLAFRKLTSMNMRAFLEAWSDIFEVKEMQLDSTRTVEWVWLKAEPPEPDDDEQTEAAGVWAAQLSQYRADENARKRKLQSIEKAAQEDESRRKLLHTDDAAPAEADPIDTELQEFMKREMADHPAMQQVVDDEPPPYACVWGPPRTNAVQRPVKQPTPTHDESVVLRPRLMETNGHTTAVAPAELLAAPAEEVPANTGQLPFDRDHPHALILDAYYKRQLAEQQLLQQQQSQKPSRDPRRRPLAAQTSATQEGIRPDLEDEMWDFARETARTATPPPRPDIDTWFESTFVRSRAHVNTSTGSSRDVHMEERIGL
eukprot:TRINITY_DN11511_c0_g1_i1.p1 TRINITY_DN11511_c0_g1~~TRINITY_DN11511_c0_g1_i1.p1  ORF type:complete len:1627 (-),score=329.35 TRINITY_DN11511_c0_g1_i1:41-4921(-)